MKTALILSISLVIGFASSVSAKPAQGSKCPDRFAQICVVDGTRQIDPTGVNDSNRFPQPVIKTKSGVNLKQCLAEAKATYHANLAAGMTKQAANIAHQKDVAWCQKQANSTPSR